MKFSLLSRLTSFRFPKWLKIVLGWAVLVCSAGIAAFYFKHPVFYFWRNVEIPVLLLVATGGVWFARRTLRQVSCGWPRIESRLRLVVCILILGLVLGQESWFQWQKYQVLQGGAAGHLGRHFVVGFRDFEDVKPLAERGLIGGIFITHRNIKGEDAQSLRRHIDELQALRHRAGLPPLFVMADQEGGSVCRLSPLIEKTPALATLVTDGPENLETRARDYGERQGRALAELGVNMNLSPVVDLKINKMNGWIDTHTRIDRRAIDANPLVVARVASAYGAGLLASGVQPTVKHFPGLGRVQGDTHLVKASLASDPVAQAEDWLPFREVTARTGAAMMLAHVHLPDIDPARPASISRKLVQEILRKDGENGWNYQGILITDDMNMGAVYDEGIGWAATAALDAGVDLVLISYDPDQYYRALYTAVKTWRMNGIDIDREQESAKRLDKYWADRLPRQDSARSSAQLR